MQTEPSFRTKQRFQQAEQHLQQGRHQAALACFKQALKAAPGHPFIMFRIGMVYHLQELRDEAIRWYRKALAADSNLGEAHNNLGKALLEQRRFQDAAAAFDEASRLVPGSPVPPASLASALLGMGRLDQAEQACQEALQRDSACAEAHWNLALILLKQGRYAEGWHEYEWRWRTPSFPSSRRSFPCPAWDGRQPLQGKRILIHTEQGYGDTIQAARYLPLLEQQGAHLIVACQPPLVRLLSSVSRTIQVLPFGSELPTADYHLPIFSLPGLFSPDTTAIPRSYPHLQPPVELLQKWSWLCEGAAAGCRVGLVWSGKPKPDPGRSIPPQLLAPLATVSDISWFSLQVADQPGQPGTRPTFPLQDFSAQIDDFADTAALISHLDLVISIDTAVAHLAGSLGVPVWLLLPEPCDWRWMSNRNDSPWYPTMRLFRQPSAGDWTTVIAEAVKQLEECFYT